MARGWAPIPGIPKPGKGAYQAPPRKAGEPKSSRQTIERTHYSETMCSRRDVQVDLRRGVEVRAPSQPACRLPEGGDVREH